MIEYNTFMDNRTIIDNLLEIYSPLISNEIPKIYSLYQEARKSYFSGDINRADQIKRLIHVLHNSEIPYTCEIGKNTIFAYGGISVILHSASKIGERANIGSCVTVGGDKNGVPIIGDDVFLSTGCKIIGNVTIGNGAIIGANAVVVKNVDPFEVVAGVPAKPIASICRDNFDKYSGFYWCKGYTAGQERFLNWYFP